jgi:gluconolactonase
MIMNPTPHWPLTHRFGRRHTPLPAIPVVLAMLALLATPAGFPPARASDLDGKDFISTSPADATINLATAAGVAMVQGSWRYHDTKIITVDFKGPDGKPNTTNDYTPHAGGAGFDDSAWEVIDPATLGKPRAAGKMCFNWYRINLTIPAQVGNFKTAGSTVVFETTVDDYGEVWVDGALPRKGGQAGGSVIKGFNAPNRLIIAKNVQPGQHIQLAVFGINGPLSAAPDNYIFLHGHVELDFYQQPAPTTPAP